MPEPGRPPYRYGFDPYFRLEPNPLLARLRAEEPVARVALPHGRDGWLAVSYDAVRTVTSDTRFSRAAAVAPDTPRSTPVPPRKHAMSSLDAPEHSRLRRLVAGTFTDRKVEARRPRAEQVMAGLMADMVRAGAPVDVVATTCLPLPITMICDILGIPYAEREWFRECAVPVFSTTSHPVDRMAAALRDLEHYFADLLTRPGAAENDDLVGTLARARMNDDQLDLLALASLCVSVLVAGHESTASQIANSIYALLTHPRQLAWLRADLPARVPHAVEELLRFAPLPSSVPNGDGHVRVPLVDVDLDGVTIRAGEAVLPSLVSANRDENTFTHPHRLDLSREHNPHLAFGHGPHHCLGAQLARMELQVCIGGLLSRFPDLRLAVPEDEVPWKRGLLSRGPSELLVTW